MPDDFYMTPIDDGLSGLKFIATPPMFSTEAAEMGFIDPDLVLRFSAAWFVCGIAMRAIEESARQVVMEDETDVTSRLMGAVRSAARLYGIEDLNLVMTLMPTCRQLAFRRSSFWDDRWQAWLDSAGKSYDLLTREEKARNPDA